MGPIDNIVALGTAAVITASSIGCVANKPPETNPQKPNAEMNIPSSVLENFEKLSLRYFSVQIARCTKGRQVVYQASLSEEEGTEKRYYDEKGRFIGSMYISNASEDKPLTKFPVNIEEYSCMNVSGWTLAG